MDSRLTALTALSGKADLIGEFIDYYENLMYALADAEDFESLREAREVLHKQVEFVAELALSCEDAPGRDPVVAGVEDDGGAGMQG